MDIRSFLRLLVNLCKPNLQLRPARGPTAGGTPRRFQQEAPDEEARPRDPEVRFRRLRPLRSAALQARSLRPRAEELQLLLFVNRIESGRRAQSRRPTPAGRIRAA